MKYWRNVMAALLCLTLFMGLGGCKQKSKQAESASYVTSERTQSGDVILPSEQAQSSNASSPSTEQTEVIETKPTETDPPKTEQQEPTQTKRPAAEVLALCTYPDPTPYPDTGKYSAAECNAYLTSWHKERREQETLAENAGGINSFLQKTLNLCLSDKGNTLYSPINLYLSMAVLVETTSGAAQAELLALLDAPSVEVLRQRATALWKSHYRADGAVDLIMACSIWLAQDLDYNAQTLERLQSNYYVSVFRGMMGSKEYDAMLREWINGQTGNLLEDQVSGMGLTKEEEFSLVSTVYFTAPWEFKLKFKSDGTAPFYNGIEGAACEYMTNNTYGEYYWGEHFLATDCFFDARGGKMRFILPNQGTDVHALLQESELQSFIMSTEWQNKGGSHIRRKIPKFDVSQTQNLRSAFEQLGVHKIFSDPDSFRALVGEKGALIDNIRHTARVLIDEKGCKAAAVTQSVKYSGGSSDQAIDFVADRPFIFVIYSEYNVPLFVGVVEQV